MMVWEPFSTALEQNGKSRKEIKFGKENAFYVIMGSLNLTRRMIQSYLYFRKSTLVAMQGGKIKG